MILNLKLDIFSKFEDNEFIIKNDEVGIFLFINGKNYIIGKFSKTYNLFSILNELFELYEEIEIFDSYEISQEIIEFIKNSEEGTYIKNGEIFKMEIPKMELKLNFNYRVQILCGNDTAHIYVEEPLDLNFKELMNSFKNCQVYINPISLNVKCNETSIILFKDGKAIIREKDISIERAKQIYEKIIFKNFCFKILNETL
ncbi:MAG: hypothetical protein ABIL24_01940 [candidate division WOR-3 bacterium]